MLFFKVWVKLTIIDLACELCTSTQSPTYFVSIEDSKFRGGGKALKNRIWNAAKPTIEAWTGMKLQPTSLYGIRVYTEGAILAPHVDR